LSVTIPLVKHFYHAPTGTLSYAVSDPASGQAAVIDPVLGFSVVSGRTDREPLDEIVAYLEEQGLTLHWILETHAHADHLSAADLLRSERGGELGIGEGIRQVQSHFAGLFNLGPDFVADGSQFDRLFADGDRFALGDLECRVMHTPGHTNDSVTYVIGDAAFVGDTLFMPDFGTARCDFPGGDAALLYDSIQKLFALPASTRLFMCHDYPPEDRSLRYEVSIAEQRADNIHVGGDAGRDDYVTMREARDACLNLPALILPAIQVNIRSGRLPPPDDNGVSYLRIPIDRV
jgi:glyoxylase-like metal-dependent hydrolase (beta-lactamase superfamily II)